jgi:hypothetical protein
MGPAPAVRLKKIAGLGHIWDVELDGLDGLRGADSLDCHVVFYPYSRQVCSDDYTFHPFEEYVKDMQVHGRSAYTPIAGRFNHLFGLLLALLILLVFALLNPDDLLSVQSVVSVLGAYAIGKEFGADAERLLIASTRSLRLQYGEPYYRYRHERHTTLALYQAFSKRVRYGKETLLPSRMDFIQESNSETLRLRFEAADLAAPQGPSAHLFSIHAHAGKGGELEGEGFMFGVKLSVNRRTLGVERCEERYQSLHRGERGCLDAAGRWVPGGALHRTVLHCGGLRLLVASRMAQGEAFVG